MTFTRRGFLGLFPAAFVATNVTPLGETTTTAINSTGASFIAEPTPVGVTERRLYRVVPGQPERHILIATAGPNDREWSYLVAPIER